MNTLRSATIRRAFATAVVAAISTAGLAACADGGDSAESGQPAATTAASSPSTAASSTSTVPTGAEAVLAASFTRQGFPADVGVALAPVGGGDVYTFGDQTPRVAWSTIKVPLALAAKRKNGWMPEIENAIVDSDNDAALALRKSLGSPSSGRNQVEAVFRDGGDTTTRVVEIKADDETFGLTPWPLEGAATFGSNLPCLDDSKEIVRLMGRVADNQEWGIRTMDAPKKTSVKGGWGPGDEGGVEVRQLGLITHKDGSQTAVAMSTYSGDPMGTGVAVLNKVADWLDKNIAKLPKGRC